jgi:hypothetical protein
VWCVLHAHQEGVEGGGASRSSSRCSVGEYLHADTGDLKFMQTVLGDVHCHVDKVLRHLLACWSRLCSPSVPPLPRLSRAAHEVVVLSWMLLSCEPRSRRLHALLLSCWNSWRRRKRHKQQQRQQREAARPKRKRKVGAVLWLAAGVR